MVALANADDVNTKDNSLRIRLQADRVQVPGLRRDDDYLGDLEVMTLAHALGITLLSMEVDACGAPSKKRPKIPSVFREFGLTASRSPGSCAARRTAPPPSGCAALVHLPFIATVFEG